MKAGHRRHGRARPYTSAGIERLPCFRCGQRAFFQWQVCADKRLYRPLCKVCDVELNALVLGWMRDPQAAAKMKRYADEQLDDGQRLRNGLLTMWPELGA